MPRSRGSPEARTVLLVSARGDLGFPEKVKLLAAGGVDLTTLPKVWPHQRRVAPVRKFLEAPGSSEQAPARCSRPAGTSGPRPSSEDERAKRRPSKSMPSTWSAPSREVRPFAATSTWCSRLTSSRASSSPESHNRPGRRERLTGRPGARRHSGEKLFECEVPLRARIHPSTRCTSNERGWSGGRGSAKPPRLVI